MSQSISPVPAKAPAAPDGPTPAPGRATGARRRGNAVFYAGGIILLVFIVLAIIGPMIFRGPATTIDALNTRSGAGGDHPFGTDGFGRDIFARVMVAARLTLLLTFGASLMALIIGTLIGVLVWLVGSKLRAVIFQINAVAVAFPSMILALIVAAIMGPGSLSAMVAVGIAGIPAYIRLTANLSAKVVGEDFVNMADLQGVSRLRMAVRHILPNIAIPLSVAAANSTAFTLVELSGLSFIGLGVQAPDYDFGRMLSDGLGEMSGQPWGVLGPAIAITLLGLGIMLFGDGLAAMIDPRVAARLAAAKAAGRARRLGAASTGAKASAAGAQADGSEPAGVTVRDLTVAKPEADGTTTPLVDGVSFNIAPGEILGIVGESGSGKSLTAMTLAGLPASGLTVRAETLRVGRMDMLGDNSSAELAGAVSLVYQDPMSTFSPSLKMGTQLTDVFCRHLGWSRAKAHSELVKALQALSTPDPERILSLYPHQLSGGLLQRCLIAQAVLLNPRLLIADAPTTALDVSVQAEVLRRIYQFRRDSGASVLFISHDLGVVEALCDRVLVMYKGQVVEELAPEQIRTRRVEHPYTQQLLDAALYLTEVDGAHGQASAPADGQVQQREGNR